MMVETGGRLVFEWGPLGRGAAKAAFPGASNSRTVVVASGAWRGRVGLLDWRPMGAREGVKGVLDVAGTGLNVPGCDSGAELTATPNPA